MSPSPKLPRETTGQRELWWCCSATCDEPTYEDPCQHCGESVERIDVRELALSHDRLLACLHDFMRTTDDPGIEALGAAYEAERITRRYSHRVARGEVPGDA